MKMSAPEPPTPPPPVADPERERLDAQAKQDSITALQDRLQGDTSSLMARYGAQFTMGGGGASGGAGGSVATAAASTPAMPSAADVMKGFEGNPFAKFLPGALTQMGFK